jgi:hypothetical protein
LVANADVWERAVPLRRSVRPGPLWDRVKHTRPAICKLSKRIHDMNNQY